MTGTAEGTLRLLHAVHHPALGLNLDFGNFSGDVYAQFTACAPFAVATHAKPRVHRAEPGGHVPVDYRQVRSLMEAVGYRGALRFDTSKPDGMPCKSLDCRRLTAMGWRPSITFSEALQRTCAWYEQHHVQNGQAPQHGTTTMKETPCQS